MPESPVTAEADFCPPPDLGPAARAGLTEVDPSGGLAACAGGLRAGSAAAQGDEALAITEYLKASKIAETAREWYLAAVAATASATFYSIPGPRWT